MNKSGGREFLRILETYYDEQGRPLRPVLQGGALNAARIIIHPALSLRWDKPTVGDSAGFPVAEAMHLSLPMHVLCYSVRWPRASQVSLLSPKGDIRIAPGVSPWNTVGEMPSYTHI